MQLHSRQGAAALSGRRRAACPSPALQLRAPSMQLLRAVAQQPAAAAPVTQERLDAQVGRAG